MPEDIILEDNISGSIWVIVSGSVQLTELQVDCHENSFQLIIFFYKKLKSKFQWNTYNESEWGQC